MAVPEPDEDQGQEDVWNRIGEKVGSPAPPADDGTTSSLFAPSEEDAEEGQDESKEEPASGQLLADKFKSPDELLEAYQELSQKIGESSNELGELRKYRDEAARWFEQYQSYQQQQPAQQQPAAPSGPPSQWQEWIENEPLKAVNHAIETGDANLYEQAIEAYQYESPVLAQRIDMMMMLGQYDQNLRAQLGPQLQPLVEQNAQQQWYQSWQAVKQKEAPDLDQYGTAIQQVASSDPAIVDLLKTASPTAQQQLIRVLYHAARSINGLAGTPPQPGPVVLAGGQPQQPVPAPAPTAPFVVSGEQQGGQRGSSQRLDVVQAAIRRAAGREPSVSGGLTEG